MSNSIKPNFPELRGMHARLSAKPSMNPREKQLTGEIKQLVPDVDKGIGVSKNPNEKAGMKIGIPAAGGGKI